MYFYLLLCSGFCSTFDAPFAIPVCELNELKRHENINEMKWKCVWCVCGFCYCYGSKCCWIVAFISHYIFLRRQGDCHSIVMSSSISSETSKKHAITVICFDTIDNRFVSIWAVCLSCRTQHINIRRVSVAMNVGEEKNK